MTTRQKQNLNLLFYKFNDGSQLAQRQDDLGINQTIEEADPTQELEAEEPFVNNTCTDRLQSRNGRRVKGNRRQINYILQNMPDNE